MSSSKLSVLIVDIHRDTREMIAAYLALRGFHVATASSGEEAIEMADAACPQFVLIDMALPKMDGWETTWRLKANPLTRHVIVVAATSCDSGRERERAAAVGCDAYLPKPYDIVALADAFERAAIEGAAALTLYPPAPGGQRADI